MKASHNPKKPLNTIKLRGTRLLAYIGAFLIANPRNFEMNVWVDKLGSYVNYAPQCGTVGCLAGWVNMKTDGREVYGETNLYRAAEKLGITYIEARKLFYVDNWPREQRVKYHNASRYSDDGMRQRAEAAYEVIQLKLAEMRQNALSTRRAKYNHQRRLQRQVTV